MSTPRADRTPLVRTTADEGESLSVAVCDLVSRATDTSVRELPPLASAIDPDALDAVFQAESADGSLAFEWAGHDVVVRSDGTVEVYPDGTVTD